MTFQANGLSAQIGASSKYIGWSALLVLAGCSSSSGTLQPAPVGQPVAAATTNGVTDFPVKIGDVYSVGGQQYTPVDVADYDEVGYASWYGNELAGNLTANGEVFVPAALTAAHKTLPLPSYVEVTALETGRTIVVRVNDRGPFSNDRLIDLSRGAADKLGITAQGVAAVRVRRVFPPESDRALLRSGRPAFDRPDTSDALLTVLRKNVSALPTPVKPVRQAPAPVQSAVRTTAPAPATATPSTGTPSTREGRFIIEGDKGAREIVQRPENWTGPAQVTLGNFDVQLAAFGSKSRADALARKLGARVVSDSDGNIWRVRYGPYSTKEAAETGLLRARKNGYPDARILRNGR